MLKCISFTVVPARASIAFYIMCRYSLFATLRAITTLCKVVAALPVRLVPRLPHGSPYTAIPARAGTTVL